VRNPFPIDARVRCMREPRDDDSLNSCCSICVCGCVDLQHFATATLQCCLCESTWKECHDIVHSCSFILYLGPCHSSGGYSPASNRGGPGSSPGQVMWDLWWTKCYWGIFSPSTSVSLPILIPSTSPHSSSIIRGSYSSPNIGRRTKWTQFHPPPVMLYISHHRFPVSCFWKHMPFRHHVVLAA
jgi:hypothetical protein